MAQEMVVGWSSADHMRTELLADALKNAAATTVIQPHAIVHSDRGNAMAESFFSVVKNERVYRTVYATKALARRDAIAYIEGLSTAVAGIPRWATNVRTKSTTVTPCRS